MGLLNRSIAPELIIPYAFTLSLFLYLYSRSPCVYSDAQPPPPPEAISYLSYRIDRSARRIVTKYLTSTSPLEINITRRVTAPIFAALGFAADAEVTAEAVRSTVVPLACPPFCDSLNAELQAAVSRLPCNTRFCNSSLRNLQRMPSSLATHALVPIGQARMEPKQPPPILPPGMSGVITSDEENVLSSAIESAIESERLAQKPGQPDKQALLLSRTESDVPTLSQMVHLFSEAQAQIWKLMSDDSFRRFRKEHTKSA